MAGDRFDLGQCEVGLTAPGYGRSPNPMACVLLGLQGIDATGNGDGRAKAC